MKPATTEPDKNVVALVCEGWHSWLLAALTTPQAAACTDGVAITLLACAGGHARTAAPLSATVATLLH